MEAFLQTLLTMSATAAVVALVVMVLRLPLKKVPRWVTCALWGVVLLRMVLPAGLSLPVSLGPMWNKSFPRPRTRPPSQTPLRRPSPPLRAGRRPPRPRLPPPPARGSRPRPPAGLLW